MTIADMKEMARALLQTGIAAADPAQAVRRALHEAPLLGQKTGRLIIIAFGKAAVPMMQEALRHVPDGQTVQAIAITNDENMCDINGCTVLATGHPLPDARGLAAGQHVIGVLSSTTKDDQVLCLISGGGSALLPAPRGDLGLSDKIAVNAALLAGGMDITQMNAVRQQLSTLKGGGLCEISQPAAVRSLIISDVVGDDIRVIASGPTAPALTAPESNVSVLKSKGIWSQIPLAAQHLLTHPKSMVETPARNQIIGSNLQSLQAIAGAAPEWSPHIAAAPLTGDVQDAAQTITNLARMTPKQGKQLFIWGGETTVQIKGTGLGGRNQELAVRVAALMGDTPDNWVFLSGGTDGRDGPTDAAGGVVSAGALDQAQAKGVDIDAALLNNDSNLILAAADGLLVTGGTGTNVADIQLLLRVS